MTPDEFRRLWRPTGDSRLMLYPAGALADVLVPDATKQFLSQVGLPNSAAPFLSFGCSKSGTLSRVSEKWRQGPAFDRYRIIGRNGRGDPIALDERAEGAVVYLNHDDRFARVLVNSSVPRLAECLLAYRDLVNETIRAGGEDAYLDRRIPTDVLRTFRDRLSRIDPVAVEEGCMWTDRLTAMTAPGEG